MASLISQMRNESSLNKSIQNTRQAMRQLQFATNREAALRNILAQNPQLSSLLSSGTNLEQIARNMASAAGIDINKLINELSGGV